MSASQPGDVDGSWRDEPPIDEQLFDAVTGWVIGLVIPRESSLRRKIVGIALIVLITLVALWVFTVVFLFNM
jgi:hypothetical protein